MLGALTVRHSSWLSIVVLAASTGTAPATPSTVTPGSPPLDDRPGTLRTMAADGLGRPFTHRRLALAAIVAVGVFVRLWHINTLGYNSDEAVYGGQGASLADDPALKPFFPTFRAHPLLFQMLLSVGYHLGIGEIFGRLASAALGIATVLIVFRVGAVLYGRKAGLIAALIIALMPYHVVVTRQVLLDGPMVLCATLSLLAVARYASTQRPIWLVTAGAAVGLTALTKEGSLVILGSVYAFLAVSPEIKVRLRTIALAGAVTIAIVALFPMSLRLAGVTRTGENYLAWQMFRRPNHDWLFYPSTVPQAMGWVVVALAVFGLVALRHSFTWREKLLLCWIAVPCAFFQLWPVKGFQYLLPVAPAVALLAAHAIVRLPDARLPGLLGTWSRVWPRHRFVVPVAVALTAVSLMIPTWSRINPAESATFLAGSGGVPGGRQTGRWIDDHTPLNAKILTIGPSMANIIAYYGHREGFGISVSPNPLNRNPAYKALNNPDKLIRLNEAQYLVWDAFSASRSSFFSVRLLRYADRYHGRTVYSVTIPVKTADGHTTRKPIITVYEVRP